MEREDRRARTRRMEEGKEGREKKGEKDGERGNRGEREHACYLHGRLAWARPRCDVFHFSVAWKFDLVTSNNVGHA